MLESEEDYGCDSSSAQTLLSLLDNVDLWWCSEAIRHDTVGQISLTLQIVAALGSWKEELAKRKPHWELLVQKLVEILDQSMDKGMSSVTESLLTSLQLLVIKNLDIVHLMTDISHSFKLIRVICRTQRIYSQNKLLIMEHCLQGFERLLDEQSSAEPNFSLSTADGNDEFVAIALEMVNLFINTPSDGETMDSQFTCLICSIVQILLEKYEFVQQNVKTLATQFYESLTGKMAFFVSLGGEFEVDDFSSALVKIAFTCSSFENPLKALFLAVAGSIDVLVEMLNMSLNELNSFDRVLDAGFVVRDLCLAIGNYCYNTDSRQRFMSVKSLSSFIEALLKKHSENAILLAGICPLIASLCKGHKANSKALRIQTPSVISNLVDSLISFIALANSSPSASESIDTTITHLLTALIAITALDKDNCMFIVTIEQCDDMLTDGLTHYHISNPSVMLKLCQFLVNLTSDKQCQRRIFDRPGISRLICVQCLIAALKAHDVEGKIVSCKLVKPCCQIINHFHEKLPLWKDLQDIPYIFEVMLRLLSHELAAEDIMEAISETWKHLSQYDFLLDSMIYENKKFTAKSFDMMQSLLTIYGERNMTIMTNLGGVLIILVSTMNKISHPEEHMMTYFMNFQRRCQKSILFYLQHSSYVLFMVRLARDIQKLVVSIESASLTEELFSNVGEFIVPVLSTYKKHEEISEVAVYIFGSLLQGCEEHTTSSIAIEQCVALFDLLLDVISIYRTNRSRRVVTNNVLQLFMNYNADEIFIKQQKSLSVDLMWDLISFFKDDSRLSSNLCCYITLSCKNLRNLELFEKDLRLFKLLIVIFQKYIWEIAYNEFILDSIRELMSNHRENAIYFCTVDGGKNLKLLVEMIGTWQGMSSTLIIISKTMVALSQMAAPHHLQLRANPKCWSSLLEVLQKPNVGSDAAHFICEAFAALLTDIDSDDIAVKAFPEVYYPVFLNYLQRMLEKRDPQNEKYIIAILKVIHALTESSKLTKKFHNFPNLWGMVFDFFRGYEKHPLILEAALKVCDRLVMLRAGKPSVVTQLPILMAVILPYLERPGIVKPLCHMMAKLCQDNKDFQEFMQTRSVALTFFMFLRDFAEDNQIMSDCIQLLMPCVQELYATNDSIPPECMRGLVNSLSKLSNPGLLAKQLFGFCERNAEVRKAFIDDRRNLDKLIEVMSRPEHNRETSDTLLTLLSLLVENAEVVQSAFDGENMLSFLLNAYPRQEEVSMTVVSICKLLAKLCIRSCVDCGSVSAFAEIYPYCVKHIQQILEPTRWTQYGPESLTSLLRVLQVVKDNMPSIPNNSLIHVYSDILRSKVILPSTVVHDAVNYILSLLSDSIYNDEQITSELLLVTAYSALFGLNRSDAPIALASNPSVQSVWHNNNSDFVSNALTLILQVYPFITVTAKQEHARVHLEMLVKSLSRLKPILMTNVQNISLTCEDSLIYKMFQALRMITSDVNPSFHGFVFAGYLETLSEFAQCESVKSSVLGDLLCEIVRDMTRDLLTASEQRTHAQLIESKVRSCISVFFRFLTDRIWQDNAKAGCFSFVTQSLVVSCEAFSHLWMLSPQPTALMAVLNSTKGGCQQLLRYALQHKEMLCISRAICNMFLSFFTSNIVPITSEIVTAGNIQKMVIQAVNQYFDNLMDILQYSMNVQRIDVVEPLCKLIHIVTERDKERLQQLMTKITIQRRHVQIFRQIAHISVSNASLKNLANVLADTFLLREKQTMNADLDQPVNPDSLSASALDRIAQPTTQKASVPLTVIYSTAVLSSDPINVYQIPSNEIQALLPIDVNVYKGFWRRCPVAIKLIRAKPSIAEQMLKDTMSRLMSLRHPRIITLYGCGLDIVVPRSGGDSDISCGLILEFMEKGNLRSVLTREYETMSWFGKLRIALDISEGILFLHECGMSHGALICENVLIDGDGRAKLTGIQQRLSPLDKQNADMDMEAFGSILWEIMTGKPRSASCNKDGPAAKSQPKKGKGNKGKGKAPTEDGMHLTEQQLALIPPSVVNLLNKCIGTRSSMSFADLHIQLTAMLDQESSHGPGHKMAIPDGFLCPITQDIMKDPVILLDGHTYERAAIVDWLKRKNRSPLTNEELSGDTMIDNYALKAAIETFQASFRGVQT